jgi:ribosomal protein S18 acetylase RimI-like enzyme
VHVESWRTTYRGQIPDDFLDQLSASARAEFWSGEISRGENGVFVAASNDVISGFINFGKALDTDVDDQTGEVYALYLLSESQGAGIGRKLWNEAIQELKARGFSKCAVWVLATNKVAIDFYQRVGCRPDGAKKVVTIGGKEVTELRYQISIILPPSEPCRIST